jgi:hypothetical protein
MNYNADANIVGRGGFRPADAPTAHVHAVLSGSIRQSPAAFRHGRMPNRNGRACGAQRQV